MHWKLPRKQIPLGRICYLAVLNLTPDSFSDGGQFPCPADAASHGVRLLAQGAQAIDVGAESTRPGAQPIGPQEEWGRVAPVMAALKKSSPGCPLSIDTRRPDVARRALDAGADAINDVTGFQNREMLDLAANSTCGLIAMRTRMAKGRIWMPDYSDPSPKDANNAIKELRNVKARLLGAGIAPERILLDPGFGFGTTFIEDQAIWGALPELPSRLDWPIERFCIGISRKRFVARSFNAKGNALLDAKTAEMQKKAANMGYRVFRVHSVPG